MAEQHHEQATTTATQTPNAGAATRPPHPAVTMVQNMISRGERSPSAVASVLDAHPDAKPDIFAMLHATIGNAFVSEVIATDGREEQTADGVVLGPMRVTARALRVRSAASTASAENVVGRLSRGSVVSGLSKEGDWIRIEHQGQTAYIHGDYVVSAVTPPKKKVEKVGGDEDEAVAIAPAPTVAPDVGSPAVQPTTAPPVVTAQVETAPVAPVTPTQLPAPVQTAPTQTPTQTQTPTPTPTQTAPVNTAGPLPTADLGLSGNLHGSLNGNAGAAFSTGSQQSWVWVSEGGVTETPNIYLHLHGHRTDHGFDEDLEWADGGMQERDGKQVHVAPAEHRKKVKVKGSGFDAAREAMAVSKNQNTIAILPQGVLGESGKGAKEGGYMKDIEKLGLSGFLEKILKQVGAKIGVPKLAPGNIAIGGHSSAGYTGLHSSLKDLDKGERDEAVMDKITDITLYDQNYGGAQFDHIRKWMVHGDNGKDGKPPSKNLRLVNGYAQTTLKGKGEHKESKLWRAKVGQDALRDLAKANKLKLQELPAGEKLDNETKVMEHSQLLRSDGTVQCDVLVLMYSQAGGNDHEPLRDRTIDDAIMSIGDGAEGNAQFGRHDRGKLLAEHAEIKREDDDAEVIASADVPTQTADSTPDKQRRPQPDHVDGDDRKEPEPVKPPPAVTASNPKLDKARKKHEKQEALFDKLYNDETGLASMDKLGQVGDTRTVTLKDKTKYTFGLTEEQHKFKRLVYQKAIERVGKGGLYGGVAKGKLDKLPGGEEIRTEVKPDVLAMIAAAKSELGVNLEISSGYRDIKEEVDLWSSAFDRMYIWDTQKERRKQWPKDEYGDAAAEFTAKEIAPRKAVPGSSNHSNGIAIDIHVDGIKTAYKDQDQWRSSKVYQWLNGLGDYASKGKAAARFNFKNWHKEAWHYDWQGKVDDD